MKVFQRLTRRTHPAKDEINEIQFAFRSARGTIDTIFIISELQLRHYAANKLLYMTFVDLDKATGCHLVGNAKIRTGTVCM